MEQKFSNEGGPVILPQGDSVAQSRGTTKATANETLDAHIPTGGNPFVNRGLNIFSGIESTLNVEEQTIFTFTRDFDPQTPDAKNAADHFDDEQSKIDKMKFENAEILSKMSSLMKNLNKPAIEEPERPKENMQKVEKVRREDYGLDINQMKAWQDSFRKKLMDEEEHKQEIAVARVRGFLDAIRMLTRLQSWWRMMRFKIQFRAFRNGRLVVKRKFYMAWKQHWKAEHLFLYQVLGKPFEAWAAEVQDTKRLKEIVKSFYVLCVRRLRLTPQAVMAYFAPPGEYSVIMTENDQMKIRRLILSKLFAGWRSEVRELRGMRFKASQILARTMRRTKGPMWVKEGVLVTFHIWRRYAAVRCAYRREEPDPQFKNPHLPQWAKLLSSITLSRIHRKRAQEKGEKLLLTRTFHTWRIIMTMDKSKLVTPLQIAINHWNNKTWTKVFGGWSGLIKERGTMMRLRDKCFGAWKKWAPRKRRLRILKRDTIHWLSMRQKRTIFSTMTGQCFDVIGRRAGVLRILRKNVNDRKVMVCAYALMGYNSHVIMLDCWRRWSLWWKYRRQWKLSLWHYRVLWFTNRQHAIFQAWKSLVGFGRPPSSMRPSTSVSNTLDINSSVNLFEDLSGKQGVPQSRPTTSIALPPLLAYQIWDGVPQSPLVPNIMMTSSQTFIRGQQGDLGNSIDPEMFALFCRSICIHASKNRLRRQLLLAPYLEAERAKSNKVRKDDMSEEDAEISDDEHLDMEPIDSDEHDFIEFKKKQEEKKNFKMSNSSTITQVVKLRQMRDDEDILSATEVERDDEDNVPITEVSVADDISLSAGMSAEQKKEYGEAKAFHERQCKLQHGLDILDMRLVALAIEEGAEISTEHILQACKYFGDSHMPLFTMLLAVGTQYIAQCICRNEKREHLFVCSNPANAVLLSSHLERWSRHDISSRELTEITRDSILREVIGSEYQSVIMLRVVVLMTLQRAEDELRASCIPLSEGRSMTEEVHEALKRKKLLRLMSIRKSLTGILLMHDNPSTVAGNSLSSDMLDVDHEAKGGILSSEELLGAVSPWVLPGEGKKTLHKMSGDQIGSSLYSPLRMSPLVDIEIPFSKYDPPPPIVVALKSEERSIDDWTKTLDIYSLLREFTLMTNNLSTEARALRQPLLNRDIKLLEVAFLAQSRRDYLSLKLQCRTPVQISLEREKEEIAAKKAKEKALKRAKKIESSLRKELLEENNRKEQEREQLERLQVQSVESNAVIASSSASKKKGSKKKASKQKKKGKKGRKGKKTGGAEDNVEIDEEPADEDAEQLQCYDPLTFHEGYVESILCDPAELCDQIDESEFHARCSILGQCFIETWLPKVKHKSKDHMITTAARRCKQASNIPRRVIAHMKAEGLEDLAQFNVSEHNGSLSAWIIKCAVAIPHFLDAVIWSWLPHEWWEMNLLQARMKQELVFVTTARDIIANKMDENDTVKDDIHEKRLDLQDFLKEVRKYILQVGEKRRQKFDADIVERDGIKGKVMRQEKKIKDALTELRNLKELITKVEAMLNANNISAAFTSLGVELLPEELEAAAQDPDVAGKALRVRAFRLVELKEAEIPLVEASIIDLQEKRRLAETDVKLFDRLCMRGHTWLKNMAEGEFNVMLDTQNIVMRMARDEKKIQNTDAADLRTLSGLRRHGNAVAELITHLDSEAVRLRLEAEALAEAERLRIKTRQDFKSSGGAKGRDSPGRRSRRQARETSSNSAVYSPGSPGFESMRSDDYERLNTPKFGGGNASSIAPRDVQRFSLDAALSQMNASDQIDAAASLSVIDPNAIGSSNSILQQLKDEAEAQALAKEMEGLLVAEQEALLLSHAMRNQLFDDYWELIIPQRIEAQIAETQVHVEEPEPDTATSGYDMDAPLGKTTRMWLEIGDQHIDGRRTISDNADGESLDVLKGFSYSPMRPRVSDIDIGENAWQLSNSQKMSVSIKAEKSAEAKFLAAKKGKTLPTPEPDVAVASKTKISRDAGLDMRTDEEKASESTEAASPKKGGKMFKQAEDPFISVGKVEIDHMRASSLKIKGDNDSDDDLISLISQASQLQVEQGGTDSLAEPDQKLIAKDASSAAEAFDDEISIGGSVNSQQMHDDQTSHYLAVMEGEGVLALAVPIPELPDLTDTLSNTDAYNYINADLPFSDREREYLNSMNHDIEKPDRKDTTSDQLNANHGESYVQSSEPRAHVDDDEDNLSVLSHDDEKETANDPASDVAEIRGSIRFAEKEQVLISNDDVEEDDLANDDASRSSSLQPVSYVRISQQKLVSEAAVVVASEAAKSRGVIEIKRNAPEHNAHREHLATDGGFLEMPNVTDFVMDAIQHSDSPQRRTIEASNAKKVPVRNAPPDNALAVLAGGEWSLIEPPATGELPRNTDYKVSDQFQHLQLTGKAFESSPFSRAGNHFAIDGLVDHELADVFSSISTRLAPSLGFSEDHPSFSDKDLKQNSFGTLLEMVERELSMSSSSTKGRSRIGKNTRGVLARPITPPKLKKKKKKTAKASKVEALESTAISSTVNGVVDGDAYQLEISAVSETQVSPLLLPDSSMTILDRQLIIDSRRERLSNITLQVFEDNVRQALLFAEDSAVERLSALTPEGRGGSRRPLLTWTRATLNKAINSTSKRRKEQRAFIRAGLTLLIEERQKKDKASGDHSCLPLSVHGTHEGQVYGGVRFSNTTATTNSWDFEHDFKSIDDGLAHETKNENDFMQHSHSDGALLHEKNKFLGPVVHGYARYDDGIADHNIQVQMLDGLKASSSLQIGSPRSRVSSSDAHTAPILSANRKERVLQLQRVFEDMMIDDDDALEQAYAAILGIAGVNMTLPDDDDPFLDVDIDDEHLDDKNDFLTEENESEMTSIGFNVTSMRSKASSRGSSPMHEDSTGRNALESSFSGEAQKGEDYISTSRQKMWVALTQRENIAGIDDPRAKPFSITALSTPQDSHPQTPVLSMQQFNSRHPEKHFFSQSAVIKSADTANKESAALNMKGKNSWSKVGESLQPAREPIILSGSSKSEYFMEDKEVHVSEGLDSLVLESHSLSRKTLGVPPLTNPTIRERSSVSEKAIDDLIHSKETFSANLRNGGDYLAKLSTESPMQQADEIELEQELRSMLFPSRSKTTKNFGSAEYSMQYSGSNEAILSSAEEEYEFAPKSRSRLGSNALKKRRIRLGEAKNLPPIDHSEVNIANLADLIQSKRSRNPLAPKQDPEYFAEIKHSRLQRKNKFIENIDIPITLSKSLSGPLRQPNLRKGIVRSVSDLRYSIDEELMNLSRSKVEAVAKSSAASFLSSDAEFINKRAAAESSHISAVIRVPSSDNSVVSDAHVSNATKDLLALNSGRR